MFEGACGNNSSESNKKLFCEFTTTQDDYFVIIHMMKIIMCIYQLKMLTNVYMP